MSRKLQFENDKFYHIYNRGVDKRRVFLDDKDYERFIESIKYFNRTDSIGSIYYEKKRELFKLEAKPLYRGLASNSKMVDVIAFSLLPNHYHFILKQNQEKGITEFMQKLSTGYTMYFNHKNKRVGSLFQGTFKAIKIDGDGYMLWLACYIIGNYEIHKIGKFKNWSWHNQRECFNYLCRLGLVKNSNEYLRLIRFVIKESQNNKKYKKYKYEQ